MKVQCLNSSSIKTRNLIKKTFAELINAKKQLNKITVTELVKKAGLTRSTFYTHYDNINEVAQDYQMQTIELLCSEDLKLYSKQDIKDYFNNILKCLKDNEETYKLLLSADESVLFLETLKKIATQKIYEALKETSKDKYLDLNVSFLMDAILIEIIKYFRNEGKYSLNELFDNLGRCFEKLF